MAHALRARQPGAVTHHRSRLEPGRLSDGGPKLRGLRRSRAVCCVARFGGRHDRRDRAAAQRRSRTSCASAPPRRRPSGSALTAPEGTTLQTLLAADRRRPRRRRLPGVDPHLRAGRRRSRPARCSPPSTATPPGGRITATQDGRSVTFALPYGAFSAGTTRLRALPNPAALTGGVVDPSAPGTLHGRRRDRGRSRLDRRHGARQQLGTRSRSRRPSRRAQYRVELESTFIQVLGADPLGGTLAATLIGPGWIDPSDARRCARASAATARLQCSASSSFDSPAPPGGTLAVSGQPGWFGARSITLPAGVAATRRVRRLDPGRRHRQLRLRAALLRPRDDLVARTDEPASLSRARLRRELLGRRAREPALGLGRRPVRGPR